MNRSIKTLATLVFVLAGCGTVSAVTDADTRNTSHTDVSELVWGPSGFGPEVSPVSGHFGKGEHITYVKFPAGMATPLHTHTHDYVGLVISGVAMHWEPGKPETKKKLSAGSHWFIPGDVKHVSECLPGAECIMAIFQQDVMDFLPEE